MKDGAVGPRTGETYRGIIKTHLAPTIGHVLLQDLRATHVHALKDKLLESRSHVTTRKVLGVLRHALRRAVTDRLLAHDPASGVPNPISGTCEPRTPCARQGGIPELLRVAERTPYATVIRFALATGAREAEVLGAAWDMVDLERRTFRVLRTVQYMEGEFLILPPKTQNGLRTIELSETTVQLLRDHRVAQDATRRALGTEWENLNLVFPDARGQYQHRGAFYRGFRKLVDGSKIKNPKTVNFHSLRHTAATQMLVAGIEPLTVSRRLGHASTAFTMDVYGHLLTGQQKRAAAVLDDLLG